MPAFGRDMEIVWGKECHVWDSTGKKYLDLVAGIAVCSTGHCHPAVTAAICKQAQTLIHCSNLYYVPGQAELAAKLSKASGLGKVFFGNSGAEANEGAIKLAREGKHASVLVNLSGRGDKDIDYVVEHYGTGEEFLKNLK